MSNSSIVNFCNIILTFKLVKSKAEKAEDMDEEEQELDLEEDNVKPRIADLIDSNYYFKEVT